MSNSRLFPFIFVDESEPVLRDVFEDWKTEGAIFTALEELDIALPWDTAEISSLVLDINYLANHSGAKFCSPMVKIYLDDDDHVTSTGLEILARVIATKYLINWTRLWRTMEVTYSPVTNYDMTEVRTLKRANSEALTKDAQEHHTGTDTLTHGQTVGTETSETDHSLDYVYGIGTEGAPKPSDKNDYSSSVQSTTETSGDDVTTKNLTDAVAESQNKVGADEEEENLHRIGNIGVTTNQQMLQAERDLWLWNYFDAIFKDVDRELTLPFFDPCRV